MGVFCMQRIAEIKHDIVFRNLIYLFGKSKNEQKKKFLLDVSCNVPDRSYNSKIYKVTNYSEN